MGALDGIKILDLTIIVQGPQAVQLLGDMGADVIKIELPLLGDLARLIPATADEPRSGFFTANNRNKRSVTLDLRTPAGRRALFAMAEDADVIVSNFKPGTMEEWGLGYEELSAVNPGIIFGAASAFGAEGPDREREGADLSGQSAGGLIMSTNHDGQEPTPVGAVIADHLGSMSLAAGILAALFHRERTGEGQRLDVSLLGSQIWAQASEYTRFFLSGDDGRSNRGHPGIPSIYRIFPTADGWVGMVGVTQPQWPGFCQAIERPDLIDDERFNDLLIPRENLPALFEILDSIFPARTTDEWCGRLRAADLRYAPVRTRAQVSADPQAFANGYLVKEDGEIRMGTPIRFTKTPSEPGAVVPELGQHTEDVLLESGFSWDDIAELREQGAF